MLTKEIYLSGEKIIETGKICLQYRHLKRGNTAEREERAADPSCHAPASHLCLEVPGGSCVPMLPTPKKANIETNISELKSAGERLSQVKQLLGNLWSPEFFYSNYPKQKYLDSFSRAQVVCKVRRHTLGNLIDQ